MEWEADGIPVSPKHYTLYRSIARPLSAARRIESSMDKLILRVLPALQLGNSTDGST
jgi:hypothetical protein